MTLTRQQFLDLLHSKMQSVNLRRHCYSVEAAMRALARYFRDSGFKIQDSGKETGNKGIEINEELWGIVGLLHDGDYEQTKEDMANHSVLMAKWVEELGENDQELLEGIRSHGESHRGGELKNLMQWSLFCCDELTGLIVATTLVQPNKKLADVTVEKVLSKFKTRSFAAGAKREDIQMCEEKLGIPLPKFVEVVLEGMQEISSKLGL